MRISISLGMGRDDWEGASTYVQEAERLGVHDVWSAEAWGYDAISPLAYMAAKTSTIRLGTGIVQGGTRTPALLAMTAMSMASLCSGGSSPRVLRTSFRIESLTLPFSFSMRRNTGLGALRDRTER